MDVSTVQCKGTSKRSGERCKRHATSGYEVCNFHGGKTPRGADNPSFEHGRYSKAMPDHLIERYEASLVDDERHDLKDEIAVAEAKVGDCLYRMRLEPGDSDTLWIALRKLETRFRRLPDGHPEQGALLAQILVMIQSGGDAALAAAELDRWIARKTRSVETDMRVAREKQQMIHVETFMTAMAAVLDVIRRNVEDEDTRRRMGRELRAIAEGREANDASTSGNVVSLQRARP